MVVISPKFGEIYAKDRGIGPEKIHVIPNWTDEKEVELIRMPNEVRSRHGIPGDAFVVMYAGSIGAACGLDSVIRAFGKLDSQPRIHLIIAGTGSKLTDEQALAKKIGNPRVHFHTPWPAAETSVVLASADLFILPTYGDQSLVSVPSKLITYMLAARPILCCADEHSDIARTIRKAACGWSIPASDPDTMARMIAALSHESSSDLRQLGEQGREYALRHMTRAANLPRLIDLMKAVGCHDREGRPIGNESRKETVKQ